MTNTANVAPILPTELDLTIDGAAFQLDQYTDRWSVRRIEGRGAILLGHIDGAATPTVAAVRQLAATVAPLPA